MRVQTIEFINDFLAKERSFFYSEEEIQLRLAQHLMNKTFDNEPFYDDVFVEYCVDTKNIKELHNLWNNKKISIDIVLRKGKDYLPIELKYKKCKESFEGINVLGSIKTVELREQSAQNEGCYSFWKDVKRMEIITHAFKLKETGLVLFVTNDKSYETVHREGVQYGPFSIHEGKVVAKDDELDWGSKIKPISDDREKKFPKFKIRNNYKINWKTTGIKGHKYIKYILV